jgi:hypothetical protein
MRKLLEVSGHQHRDGPDDRFAGRHVYIGKRCTAGSGPGLHAVHAKSRCAELPCPGVDSERWLRVQDHRNQPAVGCVPTGPPGMQIAVAPLVERRPAALVRPGAGVADLGEVHPRPRGAELRRPDLSGRGRGPDLRRRRVELAAAAVGDGRLQVADALRWWPWRMTGNRSPEVGDGTLGSVAAEVSGSASRPERYSRAGAAGQ